MEKNENIYSNKLLPRKKIKMLSAYISITGVQ